MALPFLWVVDFSVNRSSLKISDPRRNNEEGRNSFYAPRGKLKYASLQYVKNQVVTLPFLKPHELGPGTRKLPQADV